MIARAYRIFDKTHNLMLYPKELRAKAVFIDAAGDAVQYKGGDVFAKLQNCVVMYATGINTVEGTPVWEADIMDVEIPTEFGSVIPARGFMQWDRGNAKWSISIPNPPMLVPQGEDFPVVSSRVVGNLYQHPNLLKNGATNPVIA